MSTWAPLDSVAAASCPGLNFWLLSGTVCALTGATFPQLCLASFQNQNPKLLVKKQTWKYCKSHAITSTPQNKYQSLMNHRLETPCITRKMFTNQILHEIKIHSFHISLPSNHCLSVGCVGRKLKRLFVINTLF